MYLVFFDESKNEDSHPHYHIGGVCIHESNLADVEILLSDLSEECFGDRTLNRNTEFHAAEIFHRKKAFQSWTNFNDRLQIFERFMQILTRDDVMLLEIQINCANLYASQNPDEVAFMLFCERANDLVRAKCSVGMLIGDRESDRVSEKYATTLSTYRANGTNFAFGRDLNHLVDSVHFTHSHLSRFLQLADVYVWLLQFSLRNRGSTNRYYKALLDLRNKQEFDLFPSKYKEWPKN